MLPDMKGLQGGALFVAHGTADGTYNIYSSYDVFHDKTC